MVLDWCVFEMMESERINVDPGNLLGMADPGLHFILLNNGIVFCLRAPQTLENQGFVHIDIQTIMV